MKSTSRRHAGTRRLGIAIVSSLAGIALLAACAGPAAPAPAPSGLAAITHYSGAHREAFLEKGARKEGHLTIFSSTGNPAMAAVLTAFTAKYPFLKVDAPCCLSSPTDVTTRAAAELQSTRNTIGVVETYPSGINSLRKLGLLTTFTTPNSKLQVKAATDPDGYFVTTRAVRVGLAINTNLIPADQAPKTWRDLLDPKWKGKITIAGGDAELHLIAFFEATQKKDYLDKFAAQDIQVQQTTQRAVANMLIAGQIAMSANVARAHLLSAISAGAPVKWITGIPVEATTTAVAVPKKSPTPYAAMLFVDFLTSLQGQQVEVDNGYESLVPSMMRPEDRNTKAVFLDVKPSYLDEQSDLADKAQQLFHQ